ncbi:MAG: hypothetical protein OEL86_10305 [Sulfuritalea sp.]|nr:hypothetical protein [Sulfuritalea sp.]
MRPLPSIGFDRFITRSWLDLALDIAAGQRERSDLVALLEQDIVGIEARSKTSIILNRMWLSPHPSLGDYAAAGVAIYTADSDIDTLSLHWGMALRSHPFFASIAETIGRLLNLHGEFTSAQITRRLKEQYGDRASILRAAEAVLQTLVGWGVINVVDAKARRFSAGASGTVRSAPVSLWLIEAAIAAANRSVRLIDKHHWLFPWVLTNVVERDVGACSRFVAHRNVDGDLWLTLQSQ